MAIKTQLERSISGQGVWTVITTEGAYPGSIVDNSATPGVSYDYRAKLVDGSNESPYSTVKTVTTVESATVPGQPTGLTASAASQTQINLNWSAPASGGSPITGYMIERKTGTGSWSVIVSNTGNSNTSYSSTGLSAGTLYTYRVSAINSEGTGVASGEAFATTNQAFTVPGKVGGVFITVISSSSLQISWITPNNGGRSITGYRIERSVAGGSFSILVPSTGNDNTSYTNTGLLAGTQYTYRISAINSEGIGEASNPASATTENILNERVSGVIPYDSRWAYQNDASINNFEQWVNSDPPQLEAPDSPTSTDIKNMISPYETFFTFPDDMDLHLTQIRLYDGQGGTLGREIRIHAILTDGTKIEDVVPAFHREGSVNMYGGWHTHAIPDQYKNVHAIVYEHSEGAVYPTKIEFTGSYIPYNPTYPAIEKTRLGEMYGINSFPWNNSGKIASASDPDAVSLLSRYDNMAWNRAYDDWPLFDNGSGEYRFAPTYTGEWNQDRGFSRLKAKGIKNIACIKTIPAYIESTYPQALDATGKQDAGRSWRQNENGYHPYKGNICEYAGAFPASGATADLTFTLANGNTYVMFPQTQAQPSYFIDKATQYVYEWDGADYVLLTENVPGVYFEVYTEDNAEIPEVIGVLKTLWNDTLTQDRNNPATYIDYAKMLFQVAARYGNNPNVDPSLVLTPDKKAGLNLIEAVEAGNELNAHWHGRRRYLSHTEQAALLSACYDGHMGTMGPGVGVKNADPNLMFANGGIVSANPRVFRAMMDWFEEHRGVGNVPLNMIKYHQYTNSNGLEQHSTGARVGLPADMVSIATEKVAEIKQICYEYMGYYPPVHIGECGYDLGPTTQSVPVLPDTTVWNKQTLGINNTTTGVQKTREEIIGERIVRDNLEYAWFGLNSKEVYLLEDPYASSNPYSFGTLYGTSGMFHRGDVNTTYANSRAPRTAAYYSRQQAGQFGDYRPTERLSVDPRVQKHEDSNGNVMYALWVPDTVGRVEPYTLNLPGITSIKKYTHRDLNSEFLEETINIDGSITLQLGECPVYLEVVTVPVNDDLITVEVTFDTAPSAATANFADWKFDKIGVFNYEQDDNSRGIYNNLFPYLHGGVAEDSINYPGVVFTDGCGNNVKATAAAATNSMSPSGDLHPPTSTVNMRYSDMAIMHEAGWSIENHAYGINGSDRWQSVHNNTKHLNKKIKEQGRDVRTRVFIVPANDAEYVDPAFYDKHIVVSSQTTFDGYTTNHPVSPLSYIEANLDKLMLQRRYTEAITTGQAEIWLDEFITSLDAGNKPLLRCFQHNVQNTVGSFGLVKHIFDYLKANTGDDVWITTMQDVYEYLETKRDVIKNESLVGNKLTINFDLSNISEYNRFRDMSLLINADANITGVNVIGADSSSHNAATGLINVFKEKTTFLDPSLEAVPPLILDARVEFGETNQVTLFFNRAVTLTTDGFDIPGKTITGVTGSGTLWKLQVTENILSGDTLALTYKMRLGASADAVDPTQLLNSYVGFTIRNRVNIANDTTPPTTPTNFRARKLTSKGYELVWSLSTDNENILGYNLETNGVWGYEVITNPLLIISANPQQTKNYRLRAVDVNYNYSTATAMLSVTTLATTDYQVEKTVIASFGGNETTLNGFGINRIVSSLYNQVGAVSQNLRETDGYTLLGDTGINIEILRAFTEQSTTQPSAGGNAGVLPDGALNSAFRTNNTSGGTDYLQINGLDPSKYYNFYILGNVTGANSNGRYTIGGISEDVDLYQNYEVSANPDEPWESPALSTHKGIAGSDLIVYIEKLGPADWVAINAIIIEQTNVQFSDDAQPDTVPDAPQGMTAIPNGANQIDSTWIVPYDGGSPITGYKLEINRNNDGWVTVVADTGTTENSYSFTGLDPYTLYHVRVSAINAIGISQTSNHAGATTDDIQNPLPGAPTNLTATVISDTEIDLGWTAPAGSISGYNIDIKEGAGAWVNIVGSTGNTNTDYSVIGLTANTYYEFRVAAINSEGTGTDSNVASATTSNSGASDPDFVAFKSRVESDGGVVENESFAKNTITYWKSRNKYNSKLHIRHKSLGVKYDVNGKVEKLYDIGSNPFDLIAPSEANRPIVDGTNSKLMVFDGTKFLTAGANYHYSDTFGIALGVVAQATGGTNVAFIIDHGQYLAAGYGLVVGLNETRSYLPNANNVVGSSNSDLSITDVRIDLGNTVDGFKTFKNNIELMSRGATTVLDLTNIAENPTRISEAGPYTFGASSKTSQPNRTFIGKAGGDLFFGGELSQLEQEGWNEILANFYNIGGINEPPPNPDFTLDRVSYRSMNTSTGKHLFMQRYLCPAYMADPENAIVKTIIWAGGQGSNGTDSINALIGDNGYPDRIVNGLIDYGYNVFSVQQTGGLYSQQDLSDIVAFVSQHVNNFAIARTWFIGWSAGHLPATALKSSLAFEGAILFDPAYDMVGPAATPASIAGGTKVLLVSDAQSSYVGGMDTYWNALQADANFDTAKHKYIRYATGNHNNINKTLNGTGGALSTPDDGYTAIPPFDMHNFILGI